MLNRDQLAVHAATRQQLIAEVSAQATQAATQAAVNAATQAASNAAANAASNAVQQITAMVEEQMAKMSQRMDEQLAEIASKSAALTPTFDDGASTSRQHQTEPLYVPSTVTQPIAISRNNGTGSSTTTSITSNNSSDVQQHPTTLQQPSFENNPVPPGSIRHRVYDLPDFDGKPEDWLIFEAEFNQTTAAYGYTDAQNVSRLRKSLRGSARELVICLLIRPENVRQAMATLERQFGKPQYLVASQIQRVRDIAPIDEGRLDQFVPFAAKVATMVAYLDTPRARQHLFNPMILEELLMKLPQRERREWGRFAKDMQPYPSLKDMSAWLDTVAEEMSESTVQYPSVGTRQRKAAGKTTQFMMLADSTRVCRGHVVCVNVGIISQPSVIG